MTIEDIKNGTSMPRNMFLFTNANYLLPYTGAGSGIRRALECNPNTVFFNGIEDKEINHTANEFIITIPRNNIQVQSGSNLVTDKSNQAIVINEPISNQVNNKTNQPYTNSVTRKLTKKKRILETFVLYQGQLKRLWIAENYQSIQKSSKVYYILNRNWSS